MDKTIKKALARFSQQTGLEVRIQSYWILASINQSYDASIAIKIGTAEYPFWVIYNPKGINRPRSSTSKIENVIEMGDLSEQQKRKFLETRTPYIANDGDFSIPIIITNSASIKKWTSKKQSKNDSQRSDKTLTTSIAKAKFIHYLMAMNHESHKTQRQIADQIDVSLGAVNKYLKELVESNYIVNDSNGLRFVDPGKMLELWTVEYLRRILPKVEKHLFDAHSDKQYMDLRTIPVKLKNGYWSGAKAADIVIGSELPDRFLIFSDSPHDVAKELRLRPTENGKIEIRKKFWTFDWKEEKQGTVDLPLIYADLMDSADPRDLKIAKDIREIWIKHL